jgi:hypothetical protein
VETDAFTLAAAAPPACGEAPLSAAFDELRQRSILLWKHLHADISINEFRAAQAVQHSPYWPFPQFITTQDDPSRAYSDLIILTTLATRLQNIDQVRERSWAHAIATWPAHPGPADPGYIHSQDPWDDPELFVPEEDGASGDAD